nr:hypothetical protein [uncultured Allomuricauda sp.]
MVGLLDDWVVGSTDPERSRRVDLTMVGFLVKGERSMDYSIVGLFDCWMVGWLEARTLSGVEGWI